MDQAVSFRSAAFGGFQRQDVLDYLKKNAQEHSKRVEELNESIREAEERSVGLETALSEARAALEQAQALQAEAEQRCAALQEELEQAQSHRKEYEQLKSDYAEMEVDARRRAASIVDAAKDRAAALEAASTAEAEALLAQARSEGEEIRAKAEADAAHRERRSRELLASIRQEFERTVGEIRCGVNQALRETDQSRKLLLDVSESMEERLTAMEELCGEGD